MSLLNSNHSENAAMNHSDEPSIERQILECVLSTSTLPGCIRTVDNKQNDHTTLAASLSSAKQEARWIHFFEIDRMFG